MCHFVGLSISTVFLSFILELTLCSVRMMEPLQRSSLWRRGVPGAVRNVRDGFLNCGGYEEQWLKQAGCCGICGDPCDSSRPNEHGGRFAKQIIAATYTQGDSILISITRTNSQALGYFEFRICEASADSEVSQQCLDRNVLKIKDSEDDTRFYTGTGGQTFRLMLQLPPHLFCSRCVLQFKYNTGYRLPEPPSSCSCLGCGRQEQYYNCADVFIEKDPNYIPVFTSTPVQNTVISSDPLLTTSLQTELSLTPTRTVDAEQSQTNNEILIDPTVQCDCPSPTATVTVSSYENTKNSVSNTPSDVLELETSFLGLESLMFSSILVSIPTCVIASSTIDILQSSFETNQVSTQTETFTVTNTVTATATFTETAIVTTTETAIVTTTETATLTTTETATVTTTETATVTENSCSKDILLTSVIESPPNACNTEATALSNIESTIEIISSTSYTAESTSKVNIIPIASSIAHTDTTSMELSVLCSEFIASMRQDTSKEHTFPELITSVFPSYDTNSVELTHTFSEIIPTSFILNTAVISTIQLEPTSSVKYVPSSTILDTTTQSWPNPHIFVGDNFGLDELFEYLEKFKIKYRSKEINPNKPTTPSNPTLLPNTSKNTKAHITSVNYFKQQPYYVLSEGPKYSPNEILGSPSIKITKAPTNQSIGMFMESLLDMIGNLTDLNYTVFDKYINMAVDRKFDNCMTSTVFVTVTESVGVLSASENKLHSVFEPSRKTTDTTQPVFHISPTSVTFSPTITTSVTDSPTITSPVTDSPTVTSQVTDSPTVTSQVTDSPTVTSPVTDIPTVTSPLTFSPTVASPVTDSPTIASPVTDSTARVATTAARLNQIPNYIHPGKAQPCVAANYHYKCFSVYRSVTDNWCKSQCPHKLCPRYLCVCGCTDLPTLATTPKPTPTLVCRSIRAGVPDVYCANMCANEYCPSEYCECIRAPRY